MALRKLARDEEAVKAFDSALGLTPRDPETLYRRGNSLLLLGRHAEALRDYETSLLGRADHADTHYNRGMALQELGRLREAVVSYERALALSPDDAEALINRGNALMQLREPEAAIESYDRALQATPDLADAWFNKALALLELKRPTEAATALQRLVELAPDYPFAKGKLLHARMLACDWGDLQPLMADVLQSLRQGKAAIEPFALQGICDDPQLLGACARFYAAHYHPPRTEVAKRRATHPGRIRVGYVSGEFREQATSILIAELIERHDRDRFENFAVDNG